VENLIAIKAGKRQRDELADYGHKKNKETLAFSAIVGISSPASPSANTVIMPTSLSSVMVFLVIVNFVYIWCADGRIYTVIATTTKNLVFYSYSYSMGSQTEHLPWVGGEEPRR
jgi:hypothetical protein